MTLGIAPICPDDQEDWRGLWSAYLEFYTSDLPDEVYDTTFARICDPDHDRQQGFIARLDGRAVGLVHYLYHPHNWRIEDVTYLQDLYAVPDLRGQGVGRKLIEAVYGAADAHGTPAVYWMTQGDNATARQLYDRIGQLTPFIKYQR